uniref:Uncharacterized protein n=1 Tax=Rhizophora mucronata TaxID=61149 RepID=A0A2P2N1R2_RHIMU
MVAIFSLWLSIPNLEFLTRFTFYDGSAFQTLHL